MGLDAGGANTVGHSNTFVGKEAGLANTDGDENTFLGIDAGTANISGNANTFIGVRAGDVNTASNNTFVGSDAGGGNVDGTGNVFIGRNSGDSNVSGDNNTLVGNNSDVLSGTNNVVLGNSASSNTSNKVRLGNTAITVVEGQVNYTASSDARFKRHVTENVPGLDFITRLRPVTYTWDISAMSQHLLEYQDPSLDAAKAEASQIVYTGFLAQEVETTAQSIGYDFSGVVTPKNEHDTYGLRYAEFTVPLVKAVQEQQAMIQLLQQQIDALNARLEQLED